MNPIVFNRVRSIVLCSALLGFAMQPQAQSIAYPTKPIRLIVGFVPGGGTDITARTVGLKLTERLGQSVIVDNRPGAGGAISREIVRNAAPDGYTLILLTSSQVVSATLVQKDPVDIRTGYAHVSLLVWYPYFLVVNPSLPIKTIPELIAYAKSKPRALNYGTPGIGTTGHLGTELLKQMAGIDMVHVPYKGSGDAVRDVMGGQIQLAFASAISAIPHVNSGKLRLLAVTSAKRFKTLPDVPTVAEGGVPGYDVSGWYFIAAPAKTPRTIVMKLNEEIGAALKSAEVQRSIAADSAEPAHSTPQELGVRIEEEISKWSRLLAATGLKLQ